MESWHDYLIAQAGAAAALAGLVFVGLSINVDSIVKLPSILSRAATALIMLLNVLLLSSLLLVPYESLRFISIQVLIVGVVIWGFATYSSYALFRQSEGIYRTYAVRLSILRQVALIPLLCGGIILFSGNTDGLYFMVWSFTLIFILTLVEAWVILVEINR